MGTVNNGLLDGARRIAGKFRELHVDGGIPGASLGFRLRGATKSGPPAAGTWRPGDTVTDRAGVLWTCTAGGTPGTWSGTVVSLFPSGDQTGARDAAAISAALALLPPTGGTVRLAAGQWYVLCGQVTALGSGIYIDGAGRGATYVYATGAGDVFRMYDQNLFTDAGQGGGIRGMTISGANTTGTSTGIHAGDMLQSQWDVCVRQFEYNSSSIGFKFDNVWGICEQAQGLIHALGNYTGVEFAQTPGSGNTSCYGSYERANLTICIDQQNPAYNGIAIANGSYLDNSDLSVFGNFIGTNSGALTSAVFALTGSTPAGSQDGSAGTIPSNLNNSVLNVGVECDGGYTYNPTTFSIASGCYVQGINGALNFGAAGAFTPTSGTVGFWGLTGGDSNLIPQTQQPWLFLGRLNIGTYAGPASLASSGTIATTSSWAIVGPSAAVTGVILGAGVWDGQFLTVFNQSSYSITMAASGTSNVSDGINDVIPANGIREYKWSASAGMWVPAVQGTFTARLASTFTATATGTAAQNVTGLTAYLGIGTWKVRAYLPYQGASAAGSTHFGLTFGGTAGTGSIVSWVSNLLATPFSTPVTSATITTVSSASATLATSPGAFYEATATIAATAAGTLQLQVYNGTSGDDTEVLAGAFLEVTQIS